MSDPFSSLVKQLSSKGDWAVALPAALVGFVADAATHLLPVAMLSPAECGLVTGFSGLAIKRVVEALAERRSGRERLTRARAEASAIADELAGSGRRNAARELLFEISMTDDLPKIVDAIRRGRLQL